MAKGTIIIAEDDPALRNLYMKKFGLSGYNLKTCENGEEALQALQTMMPDILLLDIHMPKMDGFTVLQHLPPPGQRPYPVLMLTNFGDPKAFEQGKALGADGFFVKKDMTIRKLVEMVETLVAQKHQG